MTTYLEKGRSFGLLCLSFVNCQFVCVLLFLLVSFPYGFECGMLDLIILIPDHCLSINFVSTGGQDHF